MLVIRQTEPSALKLIQVKYGAGWYEDHLLVKSYAANGNSNTWNWTVPTKAILVISGCGAGGGGAGGYDAGASAGAGGGGGGSGLAVQNLNVLVPAGEVIRITLGLGGTGSAPNVDLCDWGGNTTIEFTSLYPGEFDTESGGSIGNGAILKLLGGQRGHGATAVFGTGGHGGHGWWEDSTHPNPPIASAGLTSGAAGAVAVLASPPYTRQANGGGAGGAAGAAGGGNDTHIGYGARSSVGGATADGAGGGGGGGVSIFGPGSNGGAGHASAAALTWGYGSGGGGGGGNSAGNADAGNGVAGLNGYVEIFYMMAQ